MINVKKQVRDQIQEKSWFEIWHGKLKYVPEQTRGQFRSQLWRLVQTRVWQQVKEQVTIRMDIKQ